VVLTGLCSTLTTSSQGYQYAVDLSYLTDEAYDFYGFNGYDAVFNSELVRILNLPEYLTRMFYRNKRGYFRFKNDFQGKLPAQGITSSGMRDSIYRNSL
jgi:hypothetical protein